MKVVIGANSLTGPLTGIGYYTKNLVNSLSLHPEVTDLKLLSHGLLSEPINNRSSDNQMDRDPQIEAHDKKPSFIGKLRPIASRSSTLVELYDAATSLAAKISLRKYASNDIFHSPDFQFAAFPGKIVVTIPDLSTITFPEFHPASRVTYINRHIKRAIERADHIVTISDFVKSEINEKLGVSNDRMTTIYPGVDRDFSPITEDEFKAAAIAPPVKYKNYFLFVSTIEPRKNLSGLLEAYKCYQETQGSSALPLIVVGLPGWNSADIHRDLSKLAQTGKVIYCGYVDRDKLRVLIAGSRALLFPSLYEGFGLPVIEAMKSGTAVLTSKNSAMAEISGGAALLVSPYQKEDICDSIIRLHRDDRLVKKAESAGIKVSNEFSWERCASQTVSLYKSLQFLR